MTCANNGQNLLETVSRFLLQSESELDKSITIASTLRRLAVGELSARRFGGERRTAARTSSREGRNAEERKTAFGRRSCIFLHFGPV